jgi:hypothetical protein
MQYKFKSFRFRRIGGDGRRIRHKMFADANESGYVRTDNQTLLRNAHVLMCLQMQGILIKMLINKYKTFSVLIYSYINTSGIGKTRNCMETPRRKGGVFSYNFEFSQLPRVLI